MDIAAKLADLGLDLPKPAAPVAAYVPVVEQGGLLHISGQLPFRDGQVVTGRLGADMDEATGYDAARRCALMLVEQIGQAVGGDWSRVDRIVKIGVFVNSVPGFTAQTKEIGRAHASTPVPNAHRVCRLLHHKKKYIR